MQIYNNKYNVPRCWTPSARRSARRLWWRCSGCALTACIAPYLGTLTLVNAVTAREKPAYAVSEAARYLGVPTSTVRYWSTGGRDNEPLIVVGCRSPTLLSFFNLAELHVLAAVRRKHVVAMPKVRVAIRYLIKNARRQFDKQHPLIGRELETDGLDLFVQEYGKLVNISQAGQLSMREVIGAALKRIEREATGLPVKLYPFTRGETANAPTLIVVDPAISAGRPVITGTGVATILVAERYKAGESVSELARDYERSSSEIEEAIRCEMPAAA